VPGTHPTAKRICHWFGSKIGEGPGVLAPNPVMGAIGSDRLLTA
jgi:hypothetical protein